MRVHSCHAFPRNPPTLLLRRPAFDEAAGTAHQGDDPRLVAVDFVHAAEGLAIQGHDLLVAQVG
jgi:hypothetical protein